MQLQRHARTDHTRTGTRIRAHCEGRVHRTDIDIAPGGPVCRVVPLEPPSAVLFPATPSAALPPRAPVSRAAPREPVDHIASHDPRPTSTAPHNLESSSIPRE
ncbi:hypothetical protein GCM10023215_49510 [Pseudonocardia yuanmonensis]|uniref:Uncharacterized protein n=1 Tax=Pseudonocardia yuanmonensis TaxID=1095914 RepID=A0ABP8XDJ5_9PSEU